MNRSQFPPRLPKFWMAGFVHFHTSFGYPSRYRVSPKELKKEIANLGGDFVFCAGDHGSKWGNGWYEGKDYYDLTLSHNKDSSVFLVPTGEYHLWFPELISTDPDSLFWQYRRKYPNYQPFHHTLIPMIKWTNVVCHYVRENTSPDFIEVAKANGISPTLNHPGLCFLSGHPDPLDIPWLKKMPYQEIFNPMEYFSYDFSLYKHFLGMAESARMGIFAGVDFVSSRYLRLSTPGNTPAENVTYLYVPGERSLENLYQAWNERCSVAVRGRLFLEWINPIPRLNTYKVDNFPQIQFLVRSFGGKKIQHVEILKSGKTIFSSSYPGQEALEIVWTDKQFCGGEAHYTVVVEAKGDWLITSPINYQEVG